MDVIIINKSGLELVTSLFSSLISLMISLTNFDALIKRSWFIQKIKVDNLCMYFMIS